MNRQINTPKPISLDFHSKDRKTLCVKALHITLFTLAHLISETGVSSINVSLIPELSAQLRIISNIDLKLNNLP